jgi:hypothetical protein
MNALSSRGKDTFLRQAGSDPGLRRPPGQLCSPSAIAFAVLRRFLHRTGYIPGTGCNRSGPRCQTPGHVLQGQVRCQARDMAL